MGNFFLDIQYCEMCGSITNNRLRKSYQFTYSFAFNIFNAPTRHIFTAFMTSLNNKILRYWLFNDIFFYIESAMIANPSLAAYRYDPYSKVFR